MNTSPNNKVAGLSREQKRALLKRLLAERSATERKAVNAARVEDQAETVEATPAQKRVQLVPAPADRHRPFPLTDIQQAYWVGRKAAFALGDVSIHFYAEIDSDGDIERLQRAWRQVVARHDMLRCVILPSGEQQILSDVPDYTFLRRDVADLAEAAREAELCAIRDDMEHRVCTLDRWPAFEICATRVDEGRHRLHLSLDLVNVDGGSAMILLREWADLYQDPHLVLEPLALSYRDYVVAEKKLEGTKAYERAMAYWRQKIADLPDAPDLPLAKQPSEVKETRFVRRAHHLDAEDWGTLQRRIREVGLSPSVVLLTAYADVLATWSRSPKLSVNVTLFNRLPLHEQVDSIVGDFTSMILLGMDANAESTFAERARTAQRQLWEALEHREVSGVRVLRQLAQQRGGGQGALMPVVYSNLLNLGGRNLVSLYSSLERVGELVYSTTQTPQVALDFQMHEERGGLTLMFDAVEELYFPGFLDDMLAACAGWMRRLARESAAWDTPRLSLVPAAQLAQRARINATETPLPSDSLRSLFVRQAQATPDAAAVIAPDHVCTYGEILALSNQIGNALGQLLPSRERGTEQLVAVVMDKGWQQIAAVLGVHAAGSMGR